MLARKVIRENLTPEHHNLHQRAVNFFTPENMQLWINEETGYIKKSLWKELARQDFIGITIPKKHPFGKGLGAHGALVMRDALDQIQDNGMSLGFHVHNDVGVHWLAASSNENLKNKFLPAAMQADLITCIGDTEQTHEFESIAEKDGNQFIINAKKAYVVNGSHADYCLLNVKYNDQITTILVEKDRAGIEVSKVHKRLGNSIIDQVHLEFNDVRVPIANQLAAAGLQSLMLWNVVMTRTRVFVALDSYYYIRRMYNKMIKYGKSRHVSGKPLLSWPINRNIIAHATVAMEFLANGLIEIFQQLDSGKNPILEAAYLKKYGVSKAIEIANQFCEMEGAGGHMFDGLFFRDKSQVSCLNMAGGSSVTMTEIANHYFAVRHRQSITN